MTSQDTTPITSPAPTRTDDAVDAITTRLARPRPFPGLYSGNLVAVLERGWIAIRTQNWVIVVSGFVEPVLYLLAMGIGVGALVGEVSGPGGRPISYAAYIAPALLATSAMNGALYDSTTNVFFKLNYAKLYQTMLQTALGPLDVALGEIVLALLRGLLYAVAFLAVMGVMGLATSWWALAMVPAALLIALGFASVGMAVTSYMKTFQQLDIIIFVMLPMFLFSATLYPIEVFPAAVQWFVKVLPLWHGVEMMRHLAVGHLTWATLGHMLYFVGMSAAGVSATTLRLRQLFLR
ncbi:ABC transporter permease [Propionibacteriaceae bacterium G1746]|uniref:ABC transporter permease n=1 Tax=Aestuariimicrobium sp. G57 TaxID=3418485 RepID=UPI003C250A0B